MKLKRTFAAAVAAGCLLTGVGASAAFAADDPSGGQPSTQLRPWRHHRKLDCSKVDQVLARLEAAKTKIPERVAKLTEAKAQAETAGNTELAARIQHRIDRLNRVLEHLPQVIERVTQKCAADAGQS